jgi:hypothetical protein
VASWHSLFAGVGGDRPVGVAAVYGRTRTGGVAELLHNLVPITTPRSRIRIVAEADLPAGVPEGTFG